MANVDEEFDKWFDPDGDGGEWLYEVSGGDWDDLVEAIKTAFRAGWDNRYLTLSTKDI